jgi:hypothetical protein
MDNAGLAAEAVNTYRQATELVYRQLRTDLRAIADQADHAAELAGDTYHQELSEIADSEGRMRAEAHQRAAAAREAALAAFTAASAELQSGGPQ